MTSDEGHDAYVVRVECDRADRHPRRRPVVLVRAFRNIGRGWVQQDSPPRLRRIGREDAGTTLVGNERYRPGAADDLESGQGARSVYALECMGST